MSRELRRLEGSTERFNTQNAEARGGDGERARTEE
jgi:hypothetical protein